MARRIPETLTAAAETSRYFNNAMRSQKCQNDAPATLDVSSCMILQPTGDDGIISTDPD
jgi:hypothetical protein